MESLEYIKNMLDLVYEDKNKLLDLIDYIRYIARDNKEYDVDNFLDTLQEEIEKVKEN